MIHGRITILFLYDPFHRRIFALICCNLHDTHFYAMYLSKVDYQVSNNSMTLLQQYRKQNKVTNLSKLDTVSSL
ncbi:unnamed protein product [Heterobilharzia americana]|nr:unnamed protein product [Heterobilharzia americana]